MNMINHIKYAFLPLVVFTTGLFTSCDEELEFTADESAYLSATQINGMLLDATTNKNNSIKDAMTNNQLILYSVFLNNRKRE